MLAEALAPWGAAHRLLGLGGAASWQAKLESLGRVQSSSVPAADGPLVPGRQPGETVELSLRSALARKDTAAVERLLTEGNVSVDTQILDWNEYLAVSPFFVAAYLGDVRTAEMLLDYRSDVDFLATQVRGMARQWFRSRSHTALALAAETGDEPMVRMLLRRGADPDVECTDREGDGWSAQMDSETSKTYRASYFTSVTTRHLAALIDEHSAAARLGALETNILKEALEDVEEPGRQCVSLTRLSAKRLLGELDVAGMDRIECIVEQWGFDSELSMERALREQVSLDKTGDLDRRLRNCQAKMMRSVDACDLLFGGSLSRGW